MKRVFSLLLFLTILSGIFSACGNAEYPEENKDISVVTTIFPYYDFTREIAGDKADITMLISAGTESHDYEPTPQDIIRINNADLFIYNGGESDEWVHTILDSIDEKVKVLCMFDYVEPLSTESHHDHHDEHHHNESDDEHNHEGYDEHIWTSPVNALKLSEAISREIIDINKENESFYKKNYRKFSDKLLKIDRDIRKITDKSNKNTLVIADRFPMLYFTEEYGIEYKSAFSGCSSETQPSIATVTEIIDFVNEKQIPYVFHMDNTNVNFANLVSEDTGAEVGTLFSCHNITKEQFENNASYISLMELNVKILKVAL